MAVIKKLKSEPVSQYEQSVKAGVTDRIPYDRLMIAYRKAKKYEDELRIINRGLEVFGEQLKKQQEANADSSVNKSKIKSLSAKISKIAGLTDSRGRAHYLPEPLAKWQKRKLVVQEKIKKHK